MHAEAGDESLRDDDGGAPRARDERDRADGLRSERQCGDEGGPVRTEHLLDSQPPRDVCDGRVEACGVVGAGRRGEDEALDARRDGRAADLHGDGGEPPFAVRDEQARSLHGAHDLAVAVRTPG